MLLARFGVSVVRVMFVLVLRISLICLIFLLLTRLEVTSIVNTITLVTGSVLPTSSRVTVDEVNKA